MGNNIRGVVLTLLLLIPYGANADSLQTQYIREVLKNSDAVNVQIGDDVKDGCWPAPADTKTQVEKLLLQSGIQVKPSRSGVYLAITGIGGVAVNCAVFVNVRSFHLGTATAPNGTPLDLATIEGFERGTLLTGPKSRMGNRINAAVANFTNEFIVQWLKARQN